MVLVIDPLPPPRTFFSCLITSPHRPQINIEVSELGLDGEQHIRKGKFNLVDLAGSERASKTKASGIRLQEGALAGGGAGGGSGWSTTAAAGR